MGPRHFEGEGHVLLRGPVLQEPEILEHDTQPAPQFRYLARPDLSHVESRHPHLAARRHQLGEHHLEHGGLARAGMAGEKDEFTLRDVKGDVLERGALGIVLVDVGEADHGLEDKAIGGNAGR